MLDFSTTSSTLSRRAGVRCNRRYAQSMKYIGRSSLPSLLRMPRTCAAPEMALAQLCAHVSVASGPPSRQLLLSARFCSRADCVARLVCSRRDPCGS